MTDRCFLGFVPNTTLFTKLADFCFTACGKGHTITAELGQISGLHLERSEHPARSETVLETPPASEFEAEIDSLTLKRVNYSMNRLFDKGVGNSNSITLTISEYKILEWSDYPRVQARFKDDNLVRCVERSEQAYLQIFFPDSDHDARIKAILSLFSSEQRPRLTYPRLLATRSAL
eukprot:c4153_g1_i2.p1 GENE.c4153_g1_i2~~c4153_g1_i2.p1  ORF type:complete len:176 (-),score=21.14 c4153_g1_i2:292-819(-)